MSLTNVDFPEPLTPVTATNAPSGMVTSKFFKLFSLASLITRLRFGFIARRCAGISILERPEIYAPVIDFLESNNAW